MHTLPLLVLSFLVGGSIYFWYQRIVAVRNDQPFLAIRPHQQKPFGLIDVAIMFFTWGLVQIVAIRAGSSVAGLTPPLELTQLTPDQETLLMLFMGLGLSAATVIAMGIISLRYQAFVDLFGSRREYLSQDFKIGGIAFLMVLPIVLGIQWLLSHLVDYDHETIRLFQENFSLHTALIGWFTAVLVAPICEEVFFRGLVQGWLQRIAIGPTRGLDVKVIIGGWPDEHSNLIGPSNKPVGEFETQANAIRYSDNPYSSPTAESAVVEAESLRHPGVWYWMPIFLSSGLFALAHLGQGLAPIPLFVFGLALGYLYRRTGSLIPCITVHFLLNAFTMFTLTLEMI